MKHFSLIHLLRLAGAAIGPGFPEMPAFLDGGCNYCTAQFLNISGCWNEL
jgi:hypothetical protein